MEIDRMIESSVVVNISKGSNPCQNDIILTYKKEDGFNSCQYIERNENDVYLFNTIYYILPIRKEMITMYEIKSSSNHLCNGFRYCIFVIRLDTNI